MILLARFSGLKGIDRQAAHHVLSQKSGARKAAQDFNIPYTQANFIVAHLGGGITKNALECSDLWSEMKSAKAPFLKVL